LPSDLTIGKSTNDNLSFKEMPEYQFRQSAEAVQKLQRVRDLRGESNELFVVTKLLQEILASGASKDIKTDIKRLARLQLAEIAEAKGDYENALQLLAEYIELFPTDTIVPEVLLRQGYILRKMGASDLAISKFYLVGTAATRLPVEDLLYSQRVTLTAKSEIADTTHSQGKYKEAARFYEVLLQDQSDELNRVVIKTKLIRALAEGRDHEATIKQGLEFLEQYGTSEYQAEIRYLLASSYQTSGQKREALRELMRLLEAVEVAPENLATKWKGWKMKAGNEIGNQLYLEGGSSMSDAVQVYRGLISLDSSPSWRLPLYYQVGLCWEKLEQPAEAVKAYNEIVSLAQKEAAKLSENLQFLVSMARVRIEIISWGQSLGNAPQPPAETKMAQKPN
jgi:tetratricopeptide (TPR) repeat protein